MARLAGFTGTVYLCGFRASDTEPSGWTTLATFHPGLIEVHILGCGRNPRVRNYDPLASFAHELGHHHRHARGVQWKSSCAFVTNTDQARDPVERSCDRYGRALLARARKEK